MQVLIRRSSTFREDLRHGFVTLQNQAMTALSMNPSSPIDESQDHPWQDLSARIGARALGGFDGLSTLNARRVSAPVPQMLNSTTTWASGRQEPFDPTKWRSSRVFGETSCDLEAQDDSDSD